MWGGCSLGDEQAAFLIERLAGLSSLHPCSIKHLIRTSPFTCYCVSPAGEPPAAAGLSGHPERKHLTVWYCIHPAGCPLASVPPISSWTIPSHGWNLKGQKTDAKITGPGDKWKESEIKKTGSLLSSSLTRQSFFFCLFNALIPVHHLPLSLAA